MAEGVIGFIDTPKQRNRRPTGVLWCADNGCFSEQWEPSRWWEFLEANTADAAACLFATAPDVVGDARATEELSRPWLAKIRSLGYPVAYVAQNGMEFSTWDLWDEIDCLFIGGTTDWKLGPEACNLAAVAASMGKWVHVGRVNSEKRFRYAEAIRADSCDGTYLTYGPDKNLNNVLTWSRGSHQTALLDAADVWGAQRDVVRCRPALRPPAPRPRSEAAPLPASASLATGVGR
ncbi:hypothetical protein [Nocardioides sp. PD653]|uniref:hypothetical protein n=1 Tax=Nocardioides sp. PD653 TaxID=393303 RepID=UPI001A9986F2|nr:hypothetical protein [Nocardioides sp. PD653]